MKIKYIICLFLLLSISGCYQSSDKEQMPRDKVLTGQALMEEVINMDKGDIECLPAQCGVDIIYDLCQEVKRLRAR
jgi:hypothetical protein